jgi:hypothetical protein
MPRIPRKFVFDPTEVGVYHCINRCVRRAFLCGTDSLSGKCFDHRKAWIQQRLAFLAGNFAVDVLGFSIMSNHIHVVVRNRPDVVAAWSDDEVARRWWYLFPQRKDRDGHPAEPTHAELTMITAIPERLAEIRTRLSSLPWFMRSLVEPIARQANREDKCSGRFFEGRYRCQPILDEPSLAACLAYVDLNPIRAGIAETPETSQFTSVYERIQAHTDKQRDDNVWAATADSAKTAAWLSPFELSETAGREPAPATRASNKGCLPMSFAEYLQLLDWTGRQVREDKTGAIPGSLAPILDRLQVSHENWLNLMHDFRRRFRRAAGTPASLLKEAQKRGCRHMHGIVHSRAVFGPPRRSSA